MPVRSFADSGVIRTQVGKSDVTSPYTFVALVKFGSSADEYLIARSTSSHLEAANWEALGKESQIVVSRGYAFDPEPNVWYLIIVAKEAGNNKGKCYVYNFSTKTWTLVESVAFTPSHTGTPGEIQFGRWNSSEQFKGEYAAAAIFNKALSESEAKELLEKGSIEGWLTLSPVGLWMFNQSSVSEEVKDLTGNGANQSSRVETSVVEEEPPLPYVGTSKWGTGVPLRLTWKGAYSASTTYLLQEAVSYEGSAYVAIKETKGNLPTNETYWQLMASGQASTWENPVANPSALATGSLGDVRLSESNGEFYGVLGSSATVASGWTRLSSASILTASASTGAAVSTVNGLEILGSGGIQTAIATPGTGSANITISPSSAMANEMLTPSVPEGLVARAELAEFEPSPTRATFVNGFIEYDGIGANLSLEIFIGPVVITKVHLLENAILSKIPFSFIVPAGVKWHWRVLSGGALVETSYMYL